ncbi:hypothetical protein Acr_00g0034550 [Actinidia rufa]|uniref:Costars domain-containing protein n=1 Tax=Actinidia rufa TaxID=165716 RepID=A0A7J0DHY5_9ERIC|nr:hypothetical protein Acr_00g0034550 [Actinidia rufa]
MNVEEEVERLKEEIKRLGKAQDDGSIKVTFGVLFHDDRCANIFEALPPPAATTDEVVKN